MAVGLSPVGNDAPFFLSTGVAASGAKLFIYNAGSTTKATSYQDSGGLTQNANPVLLNSSGYPASGGSLVEIWLTTGSSYKFVLAPSTDTDPPTSAYWTRDNVPVMNDVTTTVSEWMGGPTPTYVSATQFTLVGDQTGTFLVGRKLKFTVTAGTVYGRITASAFTTLTTVTVVLEPSQSLDSGLSAVSYAILAPNHPSVPWVTLAADTVSTTASAATVNLDTNAKDYQFISGAVTITAITLAQGKECTVEFQAALTLTNGASLILPGGANITTASGDTAIFRGEASAVVRCIAYTRTSGAAPVVPRSYLAGCGLSTAGSSTTMTTAAGQATDSGNADVMTLTSSVAKNTAAWVVGTGNGGLDTGSIANSTWYHFYLIKRTDTGVVDVLFSLSASAPTMPANYTLKRRIGSGKTDGGGNWTAFTQDGDLFQWAVPLNDVNANNPGTSAVSRTMTAPTGVNVIWIGGALITETSATQIALLLTDLATTDTAPSGTINLIRTGTTGSVTNTASTMATCRTNTSAQIRSRLDASAGSTTLTLTTIGWYDRRGRDS